MWAVDGSQVQPGGGGPVHVGGQELTLKAPLGHVQAPAAQSAGTPVSFPQL